MWEREDKALHNLCSLFSGRNFRKCQDVEEKTKSIKGNEWMPGHPEWIFLGDCHDVGYFQGSPKVPQKWPWMFCGCFPNSPSPYKKKKAIYGHRINGTFLVEILITVFSGLILYNKQKFRMCLQLVTRGIIKSPPKMQFARWWLIKKGISECEGKSQNEILTGQLRKWLEFFLIGFSFLFWF